MTPSMLDSPAAGWICEPVKSRWLEPGDDLARALAEQLPPRQPGDTIVVSEKVVVLLTGRALPAADYPAGRWARTLVRFVKPRQGSRGISVPEKMEYVVRAVGRPRLLAACVAAAVTRPFGRRGLFYTVAGPVARDLDGGRPPYEHLLFPPLDGADAAAICAELERRFGQGVAIVDMNDFGGTIRATSPRALPGEQLLAALSDNPLGQRVKSTPFGVVRPRGAAPEPAPRPTAQPTQPTAQPTQQPGPQTGNQPGRQPGSRD